MRAARIRSSPTRWCFTPPVTGTSRSTSSSAASHRPEVLGGLYDFLRGQPGETLYLGDDDLAEALPFDEQALRIGMHILEREGTSVAADDFAAGCAIKIFDPVADVLAKIEQPNAATGGCTDRGVEASRLR